MVFSALKRRKSISPRRERQVEACGRTLPVTVVENARAKRLTLRIVPGGKSLRVTIPPHVSETQVDHFIARNRNWVAVRLERLPEPVAAKAGAVIPYLGVDHRIVHTRRLRGIVEPGQFAGKPSLLVPGEPENVGRKVGTFLKRQARKEIDAAVARHTATLGVRAKAIRITDTTTRWGSCSTTRTLSFSWRIVMAPPEVLDYLAAHEVAHLREMNHSDRFWALVRKLCPQMEKHKTWLKRNGARLHAIEPQ
jgi:predicted metal-dependent hydrolase